MRGKKGVSAMPIWRPGTAGSAVAAMADGKELHGALENGHKSHHIPREKVGEREEGTANLTTEKIGDGGGSGTAIRVEGRLANLGTAAAVVSVHGERERERGNSRGKRLGQASICSGRGTGGRRSHVRSGGAVEVA